MFSLFGSLADCSRIERPASTLVRLLAGPPVHAEQAAVRRRACIARSFRSPWASWPHSSRRRSRCWLRLIGGRRNRAAVRRRRCDGRRGRRARHSEAHRRRLTMRAALAHGAASSSRPTGPGAIRVTTLTHPTSTAGALDASRNRLRRYGALSSPSRLFVLPLSPPRRCRARSRRSNSSRTTSIRN